MPLSSAHAYQLASHGVPTTSAPERTLEQIGAPFTRTLTLALALTLTLTLTRTPALTLSLAPTLNLAL